MSNRVLGIVDVSRFIQINGQISRLRCASLEMTTKWIPARHPACSTIVENSLQINLFMQNKAKVNIGKMNISIAVIKDYGKDNEQSTTNVIQNKAKQSQS
jgi:hypothetical protein